SQHDVAPFRQIDVQLLVFRICLADRRVPTGAENGRRGSLQFLWLVKKGGYKVLGANLVDEVFDDGFVSFNTADFLDGRRSLLLGEAVEQFKKFPPQVGLQCDELIFSLDRRE